MDRQHSNSMIDGLERDLTTALSVEPAGDFRARVRERIAHEEMSTRWHMPTRRYVAIAAAAAAAPLIAIIIVGTDRRPAVESVPTAAATEQRAAKAVPAATPMTGLGHRPTPATVNHARTRTSGSPPEPAREPAIDSPEVLLSASEQAGVWLLFESVAAGRLELPEEMLQDSSVPVAEARPSLIPVIEPLTSDNDNDSEGDVQ